MLQFKILKKIGSIISITYVRKIIEFVKYYFIGLYKRADEHHIFLSGAGIAYSLFLGLIPFILLIFFLLGNIFDVAALESQINQIIDTIIPYPAYADYTKKAIFSRLPEVMEYKTIAGFVGVIGLLFTSTWIFSSMRTILNKIYHTEIQKNVLIGLLRDIGMVILLVMFFTLYTFILPAVNLILEIADNVKLLNTFSLSEIWNNILWVTSILIMFLMFFALYYLIPYEKMRKRVAALSAFWTTLLWEIARSVFGYYIHSFLNANAIYGAFVLIVVVLIWIFCSSCIFIVGAEIGQLYRERLIRKELKKVKTA